MLLLWILLILGLHTTECLLESKELRRLYGILKFLLIVQLILLQLLIHFIIVSSSLAFNVCALLHVWLIHNLIRHLLGLFIMDILNDLRVRRLLVEIQWWERLSLLLEGLSYIHTSATSSSCTRWRKTSAWIATSSWHKVWVWRRLILSRLSAGLYRCTMSITLAVYLALLSIMVATMRSLLMVMSFVHFYLLINYYSNLI